MTEQFNISADNARALAFQAQGDWNLAMKLMSDNAANDEFEALFIQWVRNAFQAKTKTRCYKRPYLMGP